MFWVRKTLWGITAAWTPVAIVTLNISSALTGGLNRVTNRNGATFVALFALLGLLNQFLTGSLIAGLTPEGVDVGMTVPVLDAPTSVLALGYVVLVFAMTYVQIVATRVFVGGYSREIPGECYTRRVGFVVVNAILVGLAYSILVFVGTLLVVVPGMIAYVAFLFGSVYVAVEDENFVAALADSWQLTRGNWLSLFVLMVVVVLAAGGVGGIVWFLVSLVLTNVGATQFTSLVLTPVMLVFAVVSLGIIADAFVQLRAAQNASA